MIALSRAEPIDLFVCTTCRPAGAPDSAVRPGQILRDRLAALVDSDAVRVQGVECLSVCKRVCTIAVSAPGKWTYVIGDLDAEADAPAILDYLAAYAAAPDGVPPWRERPAAIRRGAVARIPARPEGTP